MHTRAIHALARLLPAALDEPDYSLRYLLYQVHMASYDCLRAAGVLALARVETALGSDEAKAEAYVKVAQAYLKAEDDINADAYAKRALPHVFKEGVSWLVQVQYKAIVAQVLDAKKQFLQAALRYADLSRLPTAQMQEGDLLAMLEKAARCAILSPAGPPRQRVMAALCRDERVLEGLIDPRTGNLLERMFTERFVAPADAQSFEGTLEAHQRAVTSDGSTIFQKALLEHNMAAAQRVYAAIAFPALAKRLGIEPARAEGIAAKMINEGRLRAMIDQLGAEGGMLVFGGGGAEAAPGEDGEDGGGSGGGAGAGARGEDSVDALLRWDGKIKDLCMAINQTTDSVAKAFPAIVPEELRPKEAFA